MKPESTQIPGSFPAVYYHTWSDPGQVGLAKLPVPSRTSVAVEGGGRVITLMGSLDGVVETPLKNKEGDLYRFSGPGLFPVDTSVLYIRPVIPEGFEGSVKVMAI